MHTEIFHHPCKVVLISCSTCFNAAELLQQCNFEHNNEYIKYIPYFIHFKYLWKVLYIFIISNDTDYEPSSYDTCTSFNCVFIASYQKNFPTLTLFQFFKDIKFSHWQDHVNNLSNDLIFSKLCTCKNKVHLHWFLCMHIVCSDVKMSLIFRLFSKSDLIPHLP